MRAPLARRLTPCAASPLVPAAVHVADFAVAAGAEAFERVLGLVHTATGLWLMYLTVATVLNTASGHHLPA